MHGTISFFLGLALVAFGLFNAIFVGGFFKTSYELGRSFATYIIAAFVAIGVAEPAHHTLGLGALNAFGPDHMVYITVEFCATRQFPMT